MLFSALKPAGAFRDAEAEQAVQSPEINAVSSHLTAGST